MHSPEYPGPDALTVVARLTARAQRLARVWCFRAAVQGIKADCDATALIILSFLLRRGRWRGNGGGVYIHTSEGRCYSRRGKEGDKPLRVRTLTDRCGEADFQLSDANRMKRPLRKTRKPPPGERRRYS